MTYIHPARHVPRGQARGRVVSARETLAEMRAIEQAATEGPWVAEYSREQGNCVIPHDAASTREAVATTRLYHQIGDAEFIAAARAFVPKALAALDAVLALHHDETLSRSMFAGHPMYTERRCTCGAAHCPTVAAIEQALS